jgi:FMN phosphatase YigB (HAD superfamily)
MIKTILFDLDDTLFSNPDRIFAPEYLRRVDNLFQETLDIRGLAKALTAIVRSLANSRDMQQTNTQAILNRLSTATGQSVDTLWQTFAGFYANGYGELRRYTQQIDIAPDLIKWTHDHGYAVVIATNPIFPEEPVQQRMAWAGLPNAANTYALITHGDNMHFFKPDPAYYAEVLARVGAEPDEALMVGDDLENDILPAAALGIHTYHVQDGNRSTVADESGTLAAFFDLLHEQPWLDSLTANPLHANMIEPQLRGNVAALFGMLAEVKSDYWTRHPDPKEWSIIQIVCHLLDSEGNVQRPRLQRIYTEENPFLAVPKPPPGPHVPACDVDGWRVAKKFADARQETIDWLRTLHDGDWQRPARHSVFGPTTLLEMAHFTAQHDRMHLTQLCQTLGKCAEL